MEIVHLVLGKANPERMNGVNKVVNELASHQASAGLDVSVWGITDNDEHNYPPRKYTTRLFYKSTLPFCPGDDLIAAIAAQRSGTVFHLHGGFVPQMYGVSALLHKHGHPFIITPHGSYNLLAMQKSRLTKSIYAQLFEKRMLRNARAVHILGESETVGTKMLCDSVPIIRIPYAYTSNYDGRLKNRPVKPFIVGYCGRLDIFTKGLDALIEGFRAFHVAHPDSQLWIVGDGDEATLLRDMVNKAGIQQHVLFCGARYGTEKEHFLSRFDVFAHPSRNEGLPASVLEAASMGLPCVVTKATNVGEEVERYRCGVAIDSTNAASLCRALTSLYSGIKAGMADELAENARQMVREAFGRENLIGKYTSMYEKALEK